MRSFKRTVTAIVVVLGISALSGCYSITSTSQDPHYALRHDWGPYPAIENGIANSCIIRQSTVNGREHLCRVIDGYEELNDNRNWIVKFDIGEGPLAQAGSDNDQYGQTIVLGDGNVYEGCDWRSPDNSYLCDYHARKQIVIHTSTSGWGYGLRKLWDWTRYAGDTLGCASGIVSLWYGAKVGAALLSACDDGPM